MERIRPPERRERVGIVQIVLIGVVLAAVLAGGVHLLGRTQAAWERRYGDEVPSPTVSAPVQEPPVLPAPIDPKSEEGRMIAEFEAGKLRCINGQLFRRLHNGWENIPGMSCEGTSR